MMRWIGRDGKSSARAGMAEKSRPANRAAAHESAAFDRTDRRKRPPQDSTHFIFNIPLSAHGKHSDIHSLARRQWRVKSFVPTAQRNIASPHDHSFVGDRLDG